jgi:hypothetical protein
MKNSTPYNIATIVILVLTVLIAVFYCMILVGAVDPFPPKATSTVMPTWTPRPTNTPTPEPSATYTPTASPSPASTPSPEPTLMGDDDDQEPTAEVFDSSPEIFPFTIQGEAPSYTMQTIYPAAGCDWQGVAGHVFGMEGEHLTQNLIVHVWGTAFNDFVSVGSNLNYGESGWEQQLSTELSAGEYMVQLLHESDQRQLSDVVRIQFTGECESNLAIVDFQQVQGF